MPERSYALAVYWDQTVRHQTEFNGLVRQKTYIKESKTVFHPRQ